MRRPGFGRICSVHAAAVAANQGLSPHSPDSSLGLDLYMQNTLNIPTKSQLYVRAAPSTAYVAFWQRFG